MGNRPKGLTRKVDEEEEFSVVYVGTPVLQRKISWAAIRGKEPVWSTGFLSDMKLHLPHFACAVYLHFLSPRLLYIGFNLETVTRPHLETVASCLWRQGFQINRKRLSKKPWSPF
jgi:hypothetical protein